MADPYPVLEFPRKPKGGPATFTITPHGVLAHVSMVEYRGWTFADLNWSDNGQSVLLNLVPRPDGMSDLSYPVYDICGDHRLVRMTNAIRKKRILGVSLPHDSTRTTWKDVYIAHRPVSRGSHANVHALLPPIPLNHCMTSPFRFPERRIENFSRLLNGTLESVQNVDLPWTGEPPAKFTFRISNLDCLVVQVGRCPLPLDMSPPRRLDNSASLARHPSESPSLWANIEWNPRPSSGVSPSDSFGDHDCATDHVADWPDLKKTFVLLPDGSRRQNHKFFAMMFTRCPISTSGTLILDVSVEEQFVPQTLGENVRIIQVDDWVVYAL